MVMSLFLSDNVFLSDHLSLSNISELVVFDNFKYKKNNTLHNKKLLEK